MKDGEGRGHQELVILGSTGSIDRQALRWLKRNRERFRVLALTAHTNLDLLLEQAGNFSVSHVGVTAGGRRRPVTFFRKQARGGIGREGSPAAPGVPARGGHHLERGGGIGGPRGQPGAALRAGKTLALANKESLVAGGPLVLEALKDGGQLVPVDSEHSAIFQCLRGRGRRRSRASSSPLRAAPSSGVPSGELARVSVKEALAHPTWNMGRKITIDSATLMNKGLEVIEAHFLFGVAYDRIDVVVHPQSIVHSMVRFRMGPSWPS